MKMNPQTNLAGFIFLSFEIPGYHFGTLWTHQNDVPAVQNSMKMNPQTNLAVLIFLSFEIPGYHFGTLDPRHSRSSTSREPEIQ